jgi:hypothetical protein
MTVNKRARQITEVSINSDNLMKGTGIQFLRQLKRTEDHLSKRTLKTPICANAKDHRPGAVVVLQATNSP